MGEKSNLPMVKKPWYKRFRDWLFAEKTIKETKSEKTTEQVVESTTKEVKRDVRAVDPNEIDTNSFIKDLKSAVITVGEGENPTKGGTIHVVSYEHDGNEPKKAGAMMRPKRK